MSVKRQVVLDNQIDRLNTLTPSRPSLPFPHSSQVKGELRCHYGRESYRVLYRRSRNLIVLLHIFRKDTGKVQRPRSVSPRSAGAARRDEPLGDLAAGERSPEDQRGHVAACRGGPWPSPRPRLRVRASHGPDAGARERVAPRGAGGREGATGRGGRARRHGHLPEPGHIESGDVVHSHTRCATVRASPSGTRGTSCDSTSCSGMSGTKNTYGHTGSNLMRWRRRCSTLRRSPCGRERVGNRDTSSWGARRVAGTSSWCSNRPEGSARTWSRRGT